MAHQFEDGAQRASGVVSSSYEAGFAHAVHPATRRAALPFDQLSEAVTADHDACQA